MKNALRAFLRQVLNEAPLPPLGMTQAQFEQELAATSQATLATPDGSATIELYTPPAKPVPVTLFTQAEFDAADLWFNNNMGAFRAASEGLLNEDPESFQALVDLTNMAIQQDQGKWPLYQFALSAGITPPGSAQGANIAWQTFTGLMGNYLLGGAFGALGKSPGAIATGKKLLLFTGPVVQAIASAFDTTMGSRPEEDFDLGGAVPTTAPVGPALAPSRPSKFVKESMSLKMRSRKLSLLSLLNEATPADAIADVAVEKALKELIGAEVEGFTGTFGSRILGKILTTSTNTFGDPALDSLLGKIVKVVERYEEVGGRRIISDDELKAFIKSNADEIFTPDIIQELTGNVEGQLTRGSLIKALEDMGVPIKSMEKADGSGIEKTIDIIRDASQVKPDTLLGMSLADILEVQRATGAPFAPLDANMALDAMAYTYARALNDPGSITAESLASQIRDVFDEKWVKPFEKPPLDTSGGALSWRAEIDEIASSYEEALRAFGQPGRNMGNTPFPIVDPRDGSVKYVIFYADPATMNLVVTDNGLVDVVDVAGMKLSVPIPVIKESLAGVGAAIRDKALFTNNTFFKLVEDRARQVTSAVNASNASKTAEQFADDLAGAIDAAGKKEGGISLLNGLRQVKQAAGVPEGFFPVLTAKSLRALQDAAAKAGVKTAEDLASQIGSFAFSKRGAKAVAGLLLVSTDESVANVVYGRSVSQDIANQYNIYGTAIESIPQYQLLADNAKKVAEAIRQVYSTASGLGTQSPLRSPKTASSLATTWLQISDTLRGKISELQAAEATNAKIAAGEPLQETRLLRALIRESLRG